MPKAVPTSVYLDPQLHAWIKQEAIKDGRSITKQIGRYLEETRIASNSLPRTKRLRSAQDLRGREGIQVDRHFDASHRDRVG